MRSQANNCAVWVQILVLPETLRNAASQIFEIVYRVVNPLLGFQFLELMSFMFSFWKLLPQFGVPQLLEDVVGKDANECHKCYGNRSVSNCKLISF